ncbi:Bacterial Ig-like domain (group 2) [compost metagenome]
MALKLYKFITVTLAFLLVWTGWSDTGYAAASEEEPVIEWSSLLDGTSIQYDYAAGRAVTATSDGGYVAVGVALSDISYERCAYVVKLNNKGEVLWERELVYQDKYDYEPNEALYVMEASDGSIIVGGEIKDGSYGRPRYVPYVSRLTSEGEILWQKAYLNMPFYLQSADDIQETSSGDFIITGGTYRNDTEVPAYLLKINSNGDELWSKIYQIGYEQRFSNIEVTPDDGVIATGWMTSSEYDSITIPLILKISNTGEIIWQKTEETDSISSLTPSNDGNYILTRYQRDTQSYYLQKINSDGDVIWNKTIGQIAGSGSRSTLRTQSLDNGYALIASLRPDPTNYNKAKYQILIMDEEGVQLHNYLFGEAGLRNVGKGIATSDGGFLVTGEFYNGSNQYMQLLKLAPPGIDPSDPELTDIEIQPSKLELSVGETVGSVVNAVYSDSSVTDVTYSAAYTSLDPSIASVDSLGQITGIRPGNTFITATYGGHQASVAVRVVGQDPGEVGELFLDSDEYSLSIGTELDVAAFFTDAFGNTSLVTQNTTFSSDHPTIATVDEYGNIRGISPGITYITAEYNGLTYRASVWVVRPYLPQYSFPDAQQLILTPYS